MRRRALKRLRAEQDDDSHHEFDITASEADATHHLAVPTPPILHIDNVSSDLRRVLRESVPLSSPSVSSSPALQAASVPNVNIGTVHDWDPFLVRPEAPDGDDPTVAEDGGSHTQAGHAEDDQSEHIPAPRYESSDAPMKAWIPLAQEYLDENLRFEGRGDFASDVCPGCQQAAGTTRRNKPVIRCLDCSPRLFCEGCTVARHEDMPFHVVQRWAGHSFTPTSLRDLGLVIQLGHADGTACTMPRLPRADFCVINVNGQHKVNIRFCGCDAAGIAGTPAQQLLRRGLYPATDAEPHTAFTYRVLEHYHLQSVQGKVSMFDYYRTLERLTDNTGTKKLLDRYKAFMRVVSQWRFLKRLKRGGRGHSVDGVVGTKHGELAVRCPACPRPECNLPPNWDTVPKAQRYLYTLCASMDACFRFKRRAVSSEERDPILGSGWGYFVEDKGYKELLDQYGDQTEMSTCTGLSAIDHANSKYHKGYAATGIGAVLCSRHEFILPNGVGDTQKGEKHVNMDYIFSCSMCHHRRVGKHICYDIACQWCRHLLARLAKFPDDVRIDLPEGSIVFSIPKLHWHSHKQADHSKFSLNYRVGAGRNDGEGSERRWWELQPIASSTKMMGPGQRQGVLEDQWGYANWRKYVNLAWTLADRLEDALKQHAEHRALLVSLTASLKRRHIARWTKQVVAWEEDNTLEDPYIATSNEPTEAEVRQEMAAEEQTASAQPGYKARHDVSMLGFITMGLDIEDQQIRLQEDAKGASASRLPALFERRTALRTRIQKLRGLQAIYMPAALPLLSQLPEAQTTVELIETVRLCLPSDISASHRATVCSPELLVLEARLREAQCRDALQDLRNKIHTLNHLHRYKQANVRHQGANTRARTELDAHAARRDRAVAKYRCARRAKLALDGNGPWEEVLRVLRDEDVRGVVAVDVDAKEMPKKQTGRKGQTSGPGDGHRMVSWIWNASDLTGKEAHVESLRIEWLKARARCMRWEEETKILPEEMRRVLATMRHEEEEWVRRANLRADVDDRLQEGLVAYAYDQAGIRGNMRAVFRAACVEHALAAKGGTGSEWDGPSDLVTNSEGYKPSDATESQWEAPEELE